jgi:hypothetical protein
MRMKKPLVVLVNGPAAGAGLSLALAGDITLAAKSAHFTGAYGALGLTPDGGMTWSLPRLVGRRRAQEIILSNRRVSAEEAAAIGLVTRVVADDALEAEGAELAANLARASTAAIGAARQLLLDSFGAKLEDNSNARRKPSPPRGRLRRHGRRSPHSFPNATKSETTAIIEANFVEAIRTARGWRAGRQDGWHSVKWPRRRSTPLSNASAWIRASAPLVALHWPVKTIFGGSIPFFMASALAVRPRLASSELWRAMVTSRITASADGTPPPDQAFSRVRIAAYERVGPVDNSATNLSAVASTSCAGTTKVATPSCPATTPDIGSQSIV